MLTGEHADYSEGFHNYEFPKEEDMFYIEEPTFKVWCNNDSSDSHTSVDTDYKQFQWITDGEKFVNDHESKLKNDRTPIVLYPDQYAKMPRFHNLCYVEDSKTKIFDYNGKTISDDSIKDWIRKASDNNEKNITSIKDFFKNPCPYDFVKQESLDNTKHFISFEVFLAIVHNKGKLYRELYGKMLGCNIFPKNTDYLKECCKILTSLCGDQQSKQNMFVKFKILDSVSLKNHFDIFAENEKSCIEDFNNLFWKENSNFELYYKEEETLFSSSNTSSDKTHLKSSDTNTLHFHMIKLAEIGKFWKNAILGTKLTNKKNIFF